MAAAAAAVPPVTVSPSRLVFNTPALGTFDYAEKQFQLYPNIHPQAAAGPHAPTRFIHLPVMVPAIKRAMRTAAAGAPSVPRILANLETHIDQSVSDPALWILSFECEVWNESVRSAIKASDVYRRALQVAQGNHTTLSIECAPVTSIVPVSEGALPPGIRLIEENLLSAQGYGIPETVQLRFQAASRAQLNRFKESAPLVLIRFEILLEGAQSVVNAVTVSGATVLDGMRQVQFNGEGQVFIHRDDFRSLSSSIATSVAIVSHIEDPASAFADEISSQLVTRFFVGQEATMRVLDDSLAASTFHADDLRPDVLTHTINRTIVKNAGTDDWKLAQTDEVKDESHERGEAEEKAEGRGEANATFAGIGGGVSGSYSSQSRHLRDDLQSRYRNRTFNTAQLRTMLHEHDILADIEGNRIVVRQVKVLQLNQASIRAMNNVAQIQARVTAQTYRVSPSTYLAKRVQQIGLFENPVPGSRPVVKLIEPLGPRDEGQLRVARELSTAEEMRRALCGGGAAIALNEAPRILSVAGAQHAGKSTLMRKLFGLNFTMGNRGVGAGTTAGVDAVYSTFEGQSFVTMDSEGMFSSVRTFNAAVLTPAQQLQQDTYEKLKTCFLWANSSVLVLVFRSAIEASVCLNQLDPLLATVAPNLQQAARDGGHRPALFVVINAVSAQDYNTYVELVNHDHSELPMPNHLLQTQAHYLRIMHSHAFRLFAVSKFVVLPNWNDGSVANSSERFDQAALQFRANLQTCLATPHAATRFDIWTSQVLTSVQDLNGNVEGLTDFFRGARENAAIINQAALERAKDTFKQWDGSIDATRIMTPSQFETQKAAALAAFTTHSVTLDRVPVLDTLNTWMTSQFNTVYRVCAQPCPCVHHGARTCVLNVSHSGNSAHRCNGLTLHCRAGAGVPHVANLASKHHPCPVPADYTCGGSTVTDRTHIMDAVICTQHERYNAANWDAPAEWNIVAHDFYDHPHRGPEDHNKRDHGQSFSARTAHLHCHLNEGNEAFSNSSSSIRASTSTSALIYLLLVYIQHRIFL